MQKVTLTPRQSIFRPGEPMEHVYFPDSGLISLVKSMSDGRTVEVGVIGIDGAAGLFSLYEIEWAIWEAVVQAPGEAFRITAAALRQEMGRNEELSRLFRKYTYVFLSELAQTAACNRLHSLEERCCRWLLIAHDSATSDSFPLTHEFLALMLGVQRSGLSITANILQKAGLIRYTRGRITVTDRPGLEDAACECYQTVQAQLRDFLEAGAPDC